MALREETNRILLLLAVCFAVFANSLTGEFVYDDVRQIVRNPLIQDGALFWQALTSDVWAFKGDGTIAASNYWRPTFTLWQIANFRIFGPAPFGWHLANIALHSGVCLLVFLLLRRWAFPAAISFSAALVFAVHPVHVESVAWISGSPDLLFSAAFLGSLWFAADFADGGSRTKLAISVLLYAAALGAKEIGVFCLPIYYLVLSGSSVNAGERRPRIAGLLSFAAAAVAYFFIRWSVLGAVSRPPENAATYFEAAASVPLMFAFYLRQIFFPAWLGANYPLEPVVTIGLTNFALPLVLAAAILAATVLLARRDRRVWLAASLFILPLLPAFNATAFIREQIVHDRYLYLPLMGALMLIAIVVSKIASERTILAAAALSVLLAIQTVRYNTAWANELALWSWTLEVDDSSFTNSQYATALEAAGRTSEAAEAYAKAIEKRPTARGYLGRGRNYLRMKRFAEAEADLTRALRFPDEAAEAYALYQTYEALGLCYSEQGKPDAAAANFHEARSRLPIYSASITANLATVLYQQNRKEEALNELRSVREQAKRELLPESKRIFLLLGMLYAEMGRKDEARAELMEYLGSTAGFGNAANAADRRQASALLERLK